MSKKTDYQLMVESIDHMKITPRQREFVRAAMRTAIEYVAGIRAGLVLASDKKPPRRNQIRSNPVVGGISETQAEELLREMRRG